LQHKILNYIKGNLTVKLISTNPERFFNICAKKGILIWNIINKGVYCHFNISIKDFMTLKDILHKTNSRVRILNKKGVPFFLYKNRKRKGFAIGGILFLMLLYCLSFFIWDISLEGNYSYSEGEIVDFLSENKITHGLLKGSIDCDAIEKSIRNKYFDVTWVCAEINGTRLIIHIKENFDSEVVQKETDPYDLVANKDAVITSIITRSGTPLVKAGTEVKENDILVTGAVDVYNEIGEIDHTNYVNADSDIYGQTIYEYQDTFTMDYIIKEYTGEEYKNYYSDLTKIKFLFKMNDNHYEKYDEISEDTHFKILRNYYLPIHFGNIQYKEYVEIEKKYTKEEAEQIANKKLELFLENLTKKGIQIIEKNVTIDVGEKYCKSYGTIDVIEQLGKVSTIDMNVEGPEEK